MFTIDVLTGTKETAEAFLNTATRGDLISLLSSNDRNGHYKDEESIAEFGEVASLENLKEAFWNQWENQTDVLTETKKTIQSIHNKEKFDYWLLQYNNIHTGETVTTPCYDDKYGVIACTFNVYCK